MGEIISFFDLYSRKGRARASRFSQRDSYTGRELLSGRLGKYRVPRKSKQETRELAKWSIFDNNSVSNFRRRRSKMAYRKNFSPSKVFMYIGLGIVFYWGYKQAVRKGWIKELSFLPVGKRHATTAAVPVVAPTQPTLEQSAPIVAPDTIVTTTLTATPIPADSAVTTADAINANIAASGGVSEYEVF